MRFVRDGLVILPIAYCDFTVVFRFVGRWSADIRRQSADVGRYRPTLGRRSADSADNGPADKIDFKWFRML